MTDYKHPLDRFYASDVDAIAVAELYFKSKQITSFFIYPRLCAGIKMYGIAYQENVLFDFDYESDGRD